MTEPETATPAAPDAAANPADGTPGGDGRNATVDDDKGKLIAALQDKAAKLNALMQRHGATTVEELEERLSQPPAARVETGTADERRRAMLEQAAAFASGPNPDPLATLLLEQRAEIDQLRRGIGDAFTAQSITDTGLRERALRHFQQNGHRLGDLKAAIAEVQAADQAKEIEALKKQLAERSNKMPDADAAKAPATQGREITANENAARRMTQAQFDAEKAKLPMRESLALQRAYNQGKINITG